MAALAAVWALLATGLYLGGVPWATLHTLLTLVLDPLWFLGVYAGLTALTPLAVALVRRFGARAALIPFLVVAGVDAMRFGIGVLPAAGWINVAAGWMVPYLLGIAWARGAFRGRTGPALMLALGTAATAALVLWAGYPASMVGVNGAVISNLNPPTLAVVTFGIAQVGLALLLRPVLARWMQRPVAWAMVAMANLSAMTLFLWHQTAFLTVTMTGLLIGRLPRAAHRSLGRRVGRGADRLAPRLRRGARHFLDDLPADRAEAALPATRPRRRRGAARTAPERPRPGASGAGLALVAIAGPRRGLEGQRAGVDAIALAGRSRPVAKDVTQMTAAATADHLRAPHEQAAPRAQFDRAGEGRL